MSDQQSTHTLQTPDPTPAEIREKSREIRESWSPRVRQARRAMAMGITRADMLGRHLETAIVEDPRVQWWR